MSETRDACTFCGEPTLGLPDQDGNQCWVCSKEECLTKLEAVLDVRMQLRSDYSKLMKMDVRICIEKEH